MTVAAGWTASARRAGVARRFAPYGALATLIAVLGIGRATGALDPDRAIGLGLTVATFAVLNTSAMAFLLRAAAHPRLVREERRPWWLLTGGMVAYMAGGALNGIAVEAGGVAVAHPAILVVYTASRVLVVVLFLSGLLLLVAEPLDRQARLRLWLDNCAVLGGGVIVLWYVLVGPALTDIERGSLVRVFAVVWPLLDLMLLIGVCAVLVRGTTTSALTSLRLLLLAMIVNLVAALVQVYRILYLPDSTQTSERVLGDAIVIGLVAVAARERCLLAAGLTNASRHRALRPHSSVPYFALTAGFCVLAFAAARSDAYPWPGLVFGAAILTAAIAARQELSLREIRRLSVTDPLTGLANRLLLWQEIERTSARSRRSGAPMAVLLLDLDGFKQINDRYGHDSGDALLVAFADVLTHSVRATDFVARLGGDEFALVLEDVTEHRAVAVAERVREACVSPVPLGRLGPDGGVPIACSIGIAVGDPLEPAGIPDAQELLHRADTAMYRSKHSAGRSWSLHRPDPSPVGPGQTSQEAGDEPEQIRAPQTGL